MRHVVFGFVAALALSTSTALAACGQCSAGKEYLQVGVGDYDVLNQKDGTASFSAEYQYKDVYYGLRPMTGILATGQGAVYGYAGGRWDLPLGLGPIVIAPSFTVGAYSQGDGKDLGHALEFRSGISAEYQFENDHRLGLSFSHISNASIGHKNPGVEILQATYAVPVTLLSGY